MSLSKEDLKEIRQLIVEGTMEALNAVIIPRLEKIEARLDRIEARLDEHDARFDRIEAHLAEHDKRFNDIDAQLANIDMRLASLEGRVEALENDVKELYGMVPQQDAKLTPEQRLRRLDVSLQALARELNVQL